MDIDAEIIKLKKRIDDLEARVADLEGDGDDAAETPQPDAPAPAEDPKPVA